MIGARLLDVELSSDTYIYPGAFFYVSLGRWGRGIPLMALRWDEVQDGDAPSASTAPFHVDGTYTHRLTFLLERSTNLEDRQARSLKTFTQERQFVLGGPYGPNLRLHRFDTVCLVAKGIGIAGVFPHALSLAARKQHDRERKHDRRTGSSIKENFYRDRTRKLNLVWILERNSDYQWMRDSMEHLMNNDPSQVMYRPLSLSALLTIAAHLQYRGSRDGTQASATSDPRAFRKVFQILPRRQRMGQGFGLVPEVLYGWSRRLRRSR